MARKPGVCVKNGYWYSEAGGRSRYFGRVDTVSRTQAMALLWRALAEGVGSQLGGDDGRASPANSSRDSGRKERTPGADSGVLSFLPPTPTPKASPNPTPQYLPTLTVNDLAERFLA